MNFNRVMIGVNATLTVLWVCVFLATERWLYILLMCVSALSVAMGVRADRKWSRR